METEIKAAAAEKGESMMRDYKVPKKCQMIIDGFWEGTGYNKLTTKNWGIIDDAMIYTYRKMTEESPQAAERGK